MNDSWTDTQIEGQINRRTGGQTDTWIDKWTNRHTERQTHCYMDEWRERKDKREAVHKTLTWTNVKKEKHRQLDVQRKTEGQTWTDREMNRANRQTDRQTAGFTRVGCVGGNKNIELIQLFISVDAIWCTKFQRVADFLFKCYYSFWRIKE